MTFRHSRASSADGRRLIPERNTGMTLLADHSIDYRDRYHGAMIGTAVGDALGRPLEGLSSRLIAESFGHVTDFIPPGRWSRRRNGTFTDDTEMALCIAQSIVEFGHVEPEDLANRFRAWVRVGRGMGSATRAACRRLADGIPWYEAGSDSAGNGAAMRAAPVGLFHPCDVDALREAAAVTAVVTHNDPTAVASTIIVAYVVAHLLHVRVGSLDPAVLLSGIETALTGVEDPALESPRDWQSETSLLGRVRDVFEMDGRPIDEIYDLTRNGPFVVESLPAALGAFLSSPEDPERAIIVAVNGGHDADTVGAMAGAFAGAYHGASGLPRRWLDNIEFRTGLEGVADEILFLTNLGTRATVSRRSASNEYAPFVRDGERWITKAHYRASQRYPDEATDIRLMPHPAAVRTLTARPVRATPPTS